MSETSSLFVNFFQPIYRHFYIQAVKAEVGQSHSIGITEKSAEKMIDKIVKLKDKYIAMCRESYMPDNIKTALESLIEQRITILTK